MFPDIPSRMPARRRRPGLLEEAGRGHQLAGRAEAALESVVLDEGRLQGMKRAPLGEAFDRRHPLLLHRGRQGEAGEDAASVDEDGAGAALAVVAALLGAGMVQFLAEEIEQGDPPLDLGLDRGAIEGEAEAHEPAWRREAGSGAASGPPGPAAPGAER